MKYVTLFLLTLAILTSSISQASESHHNLTSQTLGNAIGIFNIEYSYKLSDHWTIGATGADGHGKLGPYKLSGSSYGAVMRRYFKPALGDSSFYLIAKADRRSYEFSIDDSNKTYRADHRGWIVAGGGGYQWFWKSFNIGLGVLATNQGRTTLKTSSGEPYSNTLNLRWDLDFTVGGKF